MRPTSNGSLPALCPGVSSVCRGMQAHGTGGLTQKSTRSPLNEINDVIQGSAVLRLKLALLCFQRRTVACLANSLLDRMGVQVAFHTYDAPREVSRYSRFGCDVLDCRRDRLYAVTTAHIADFKLHHCGTFILVEQSSRIHYATVISENDRDVIPVQSS